MIYYPSRLKYVEIAAEESELQPLLHPKAHVKSTEWGLSIVVAWIAVIHLFVLYSSLPRETNLSNLVFQFLSLYNYRLPSRHIDPFPRRWSTCTDLFMGHFSRRQFSSPRNGPIRTSAITHI